MLKVLKYVDQSIMLSEHLSVKNLIHSNTAVLNNIPNNLPNDFFNHAKELGKLYDQIHKKFKGNININSGYRSDALNRRIGGALNSEHSFGAALDLSGKNGVTNADIFYYIMENLNFGTLIWEFGNKQQPQWVHVDLGVRFKHKKRILRAIKVNGKTKYEQFKNTKSTLVEKFVSTFKIW
jgi:zinc D-Ala-D-Ala carboxypeptidase